MGVQCPRLWATLIGMGKAETADHVASNLFEHRDLLRITWLQRAVNVPVVGSVEYECALALDDPNGRERIRARLRQYLVGDRSTDRQLAWDLRIDERSSYPSSYPSTDPEAPIGKLGMYLRDLAAEQLGESEALRVNQALLRRLKVPGAQFPSIESFATDDMERGRDYGYLVPLQAGTVIFTERMTPGRARYWSLQVLDAADGERALAESPASDGPLAETAVLLARAYREQTDALVGRIVSELNAGLE